MSLTHGRETNRSITVLIKDCAMSKTIHSEPKLADPNEQSIEIEWFTTKMDTDLFRILKATESVAYLQIKHTIRKTELFVGKEKLYTVEKAQKEQCPVLLSFL